MSSAWGGDGRQKESRHKGSCQKRGTHRALVKYCRSHSAKRSTPSEAFCPLSVVWRRFARFHLTHESFSRHLLASCRRAPVPRCKQRQARTAEQVDDRGQLRGGDYIQVGEVVLTRRGREAVDEIAV